MGLFCMWAGTVTIPNDKRPLPPPLKGSCRKYGHRNQQSKFICQAMTGIMTGIEGFRTKNPRQPSDYAGVKSIYGAQGRTRTYYVRYCFICV